MKNKRLLFSALSIALVGVIGTTGVLLTNSKYTTTVKGKATTNIAKWVFDVTGKDSYSPSDTIKTINLAETCRPNTLVDGNIAPGTEGSFEITIDTQGAEVGIDYEIEFANLPANFPKNLVFTFDNNNFNLETGFKGNIPANAVAKDKVITKTVNWKWVYESEDSATVENEDKEDTADGIAGAKGLTFDIIVKGTQVKPVQ